MVAIPGWLQPWSGITWLYRLSSSLLVLVLLVYRSSYPSSLSFRLLLLMCLKMLQDVISSCRETQTSKCRVFPDVKGHYTEMTRGNPKT